MLPGINITDFRLDHLQVAPRGEAEFNADAPVTCSVRVDVGFTVREDQVFETALRVKLDVDEFEGKANLPYDVSVAIRGLFETPLKMSDRSLPAPLALNSLIILYGTLRGFIAQTTSKFQHDALILPGVTFDAVIARLLEDPKSAVVPVDLPASAPGAMEAVGFIYALNDLPLAVSETANGDLRKDLLMLVEDLKKATSSPPSTPDELESFQKPLVAMEERIGALDNHLYVLIRSLVGRLRMGFEGIRARTEASAAEQKMQSGEVSDQLGTQ